MPLTDPLPSLEEILDSIGTGGVRLAGIDATEGGAGNVSVCIGWPIEVRRQFPMSGMWAVGTLAGVHMIFGGSSVTSICSAARSAAKEAQA